MLFIKSVHLFSINLKIVLVFNNMWKSFKQFIYKLVFVPLIRVVNLARWKIYLNNKEQIKLVIGAGPTIFAGWFSTDKDVLDITKREDFLKYFPQKKIHRILAEHVLEHLTDSELRAAAKNLAEFSTQDINIRIAVPDGYHASPDYIELVKPGGSGASADDHKQLFNYKTLPRYFEPYGFEPTLLEYWDENCIFHTSYKKDEDGFIERSLIHDDRNKSGKPIYTSLIIDFKHKPIN